ncbi:MAG: dioxygenase [Micrococcus sp.]|nr:dioxygenase [Micrococcus sp.]
MNLDETNASAAASGASATESFRRSGQVHQTEVDQARVHELASALIDAAPQIVMDKKVTYEEFNALKAWLITVREDESGTAFDVTGQLRSTDDDISSAVKPELILDIQEGEDGNSTNYDFVLDPAREA